MIEDTKDREDITLELGDVLWYVATLAHDIGFTLEQVAMMNYYKLQKRKEQNKLGGSGDHREDVEDTIEKHKKKYVLTPGLFLLILSLGIIIGFVSRWI